MLAEEKIIEELKHKFNFLEGQIRLQRQRRIFLEVDYAHFRELLDYAIKQMNFTRLCAITGLDNVNSLGCLYHLSRNDGITLNMKIDIPRGKPIIQTITAYFSSAEIYERELIDLFGIKVEGLSDGNRYPLTDDWPKDEFPLRKDWKRKDRVKEA
jgi:NADH:ubiquinone oxidoreductase subunit C